MEPGCIRDSYLANSVRKNSKTVFLAWCIISLMLLMTCGCATKRTQGVIISHVYNPNVYPKQGAFSCGKTGLKCEFIDLAWWSESYSGKFPSDSADKFSWGETCFAVKLDGVIPEKLGIPQDNEVVIAIIDSSFAVDSIQASLLWKNPGEVEGDGIDNDNNGYTDDIVGASIREGYPLIEAGGNTESHGTLLLNILAGSRFGFKGLMCGSSAKIILIRVLDDQGFCGVDQVISGIKYAEQCGAEICCFSLTMNIKDDKLKSQMEQSNMLFVVPAGNEGTRLGEVSSYPAMYNLDNVISVAAMRADGYISEVSNYSRDYVDIAAPGADIVTMDGNGRMILCSGTSYAVPFVVAEAVRIRACSSSTSAKEIKKQIVQNAVFSENLTGMVQSAGYISFGAIESYE